MSLQALYTLSSGSNGLVRGTRGHGLSYNVPLTSLFPIDGDSVSDFMVTIIDYGTNYYGAILKVIETSEVLADEATFIDYEGLHSYLHNAVGSVEVSEPNPDTAIDAALDEIRDHANRSMEGELDEDEEDFYDEDEVDADGDEDELEEANEEDVDLDGEGDYEVLTLEKPKGKKNSKAWKKALLEMIGVLVEYFGDSMDEDGIDEEVLQAVLPEVFDEYDTYDVRTDKSLLEQFSDYIEFEDE